MVKENKSLLKDFTDTKIIYEVISKSYEYAKKFVDKVESGRAKSRETYKDMKDIIELIENNKDMKDIIELIENNFINFKNKH